MIVRSEDNPEPTPESLSLTDSLGSIVLLCFHADLYRDWTVAELEHYFMPPLQAGSCRIWFDDAGWPVAFVTWALVDEAAHAELLRTGATPEPDGWSGGEHLWIMDMIAPFGHAKAVIRDMRETIFNDRFEECHAIARAPDHTIRRVRRWTRTLDGGDGETG